MPFSTRVRANVTNNIPANHEAQLNLSIHEAIAFSTRFGRALTAANTPRRTGRTANSVQASIDGAGSRVTGKFGSNSEIFGYLEFGTRPHEIHPRFKKALFWPTARHPVKSVHHRGTSAQHILEHAGEATGEVAKDRLGEVFEDVFG